MIQDYHNIDSDVTKSHTMFGPNITSNRGNTMRHNLDRMVMDYVALSKDFLKSHHFVTIVADVMFVNGAPFLIIMSRGIKFVTIEHAPTNTAKQFSKS